MPHKNTLIRVSICGQMGFVHKHPHLHGLENEDPDVFLFQFEVLCRGYGYCANDKKLNVFPLTLKGTSL